MPHWVTVWGFEHDKQYDRMGAAHDLPISTWWDSSRENYWETTYRGSWLFVGYVNKSFIYGRSKSSRPDLVLFKIKLKYLLLLIVARLRTRHAQYDLSYKYFVHFSVWTKCLSDGVENANTKLYTSFWRTSQTIATSPSKNLCHNSLFRMKRASATLILSQNNKACTGTNESVKIVISLHCIFSMSNANNRWLLKCTKYL